jgi:hypothetical protein
MTMKKSDVKIGATYLVKVAGNLAPVKITREHDGGWDGASVKTGKTIRIKSAQRLRKRLDDDAPVASKAAKATKDARPARKRDTGERGATGGQRDGKPMSLLNAAAHLLSQNPGEAMTCLAIVESAAAQGLWTPRAGKTPANTLYAAISREIKTKGDASRFTKAERGKFGFNATAAK